MASRGNRRLGVASPGAQLPAGDLLTRYRACQWARCRSIGTANGRHDGARGIVRYSWLWGW